MVVSSHVTGGTKNRQNGTAKGSGTSETLATPFIDMPWHEDAWTALQIESRRMVALIGEPGTGKTTFGHRAAITATGEIPEEIPGSPEVDRYDILGRLEEVGGHVQFKDGKLTSSLKNGKWLIVEDFSAIPVDVRAVFLACRDRPEFTNALNGEVIPIPADWRCIATSNEEALTCRKNSLSRILFDGVLVVDVPPLTDRQSRKLLREHFPDAKKANFEIAFKRWSEFRDIVHKGASGKTHLSIRSAMDLLALLEKGMHEKRAIQISLRNKFLAGGDKDLYDVADLKTSVDCDSASAPDATDASETPEDPGDPTIRPQSDD